MIGEINVPKYYKQISWNFTLFSHGNKNKKFVDRSSFKKIHFPTSPFPSSWLLNILGIFKSKIYTSKKTTEKIQNFYLQEYIEILSKSVDCLADVDMESDKTTESGSNPEQAKSNLQPIN